MSSVRARHLAIGFALYFGLVAYFAYAYARRSSGPWFTPAVSQLVYQTTMIGGVIVLAGLLAVAGRAASPEGARNASASAVSLPWPSSEPSSGFSPRRPVAGREAWDVGDIVDDSTFDGTEYASRRRAQDAAAVSAALDRMGDRSSGSAPAALLNRLSQIRVREAIVSGSGRGDMAQALIRLTEEMRPLLVAARDAGLEVSEVQQRFSQAMLGREGDLAYRIRLIERMKAALESALSERVQRELNSLRWDLERAKVVTDQAHGAELAAAEAVALLDTGHNAAAFERTQDARRLLEEHLHAPLPAVPRSSAAPASLAAFIGPTFAAAAYVAIAAMLLPGVTGFLEANYTLNTGVILFLSYGWLGLVAYAILSIFVALHPPSAPIDLREWESYEDDY